MERAGLGVGRGDSWRQLSLLVVEENHDAHHFRAKDTRQPASTRGFPSHTKTEISRSSRWLFRALSRATSATNERGSCSSNVSPSKMPSKRSCVTVASYILRRCVATRLHRFVVVNAVSRSLVAPFIEKNQGCSRYFYHERRYHLESITTEIRTRIKQLQTDHKKVSIKGIVRHIIFFSTPSVTRDIATVFCSR